MRYYLSNLLIIGCLFIESGCSEPKEGSPSQTESAQSTVSETPPASSPVVETAPPSEKTPSKENSSTTVQAPANEPAPQAEVTAAEIATENVPTVEPTTAASALAVIDLEKLPTLAVKQAFDSQPMSLYYVTEGSVGGVGESVMKELTNAGWKETKHLVTSTDQYVDRLLTKEGYYLRLTISTGGSRGEIAVNLAVLGNFDVRTLPQTKDAEVQESTPVMAGHRSRLSIPDAYDDLSKRMTDAGWQVVQDFHSPMADVPHYRSIRFRKNAMRVNLGFVKDPAKPAEKISIFYHAESVIPIDLPMIDHHQPMKFDVSENRAFIPFLGDRAAIVELLTKQANNFGWQLMGADDFVQEKTTVLYLSVGTPVGIAVRRVESAGSYYLAMERVKLPTKKTSESTEDAASKIAQSTETPSNAAATKMKSEIDAQVAQVEDAITKTVNDELAKALGSLSGGGGAKPDMQALQAQAAKLQAQFGAADDKPTAATGSNASNKQANVLDVPNDEEPINQEDQAIKASEAHVKLGKSDIVLKHVLSYARMEDGAPTKIILLSDKPLLAEKIDKLCASGESFTIYDGFSKDRPEASLELRISGNNVMMQLAAGGHSISTNSSDIQSTVRLKNGKLQGRVKLTKPMKLRDESLSFEAAIADKVRK